MSDEHMSFKGILWAIPLSILGWCLAILCIWLFMSFGGY